MLKTSDKVNAPLKVGSNVLIEIPSVDKAKTDLRNIIGVVMEVNDHGLHKIGTKTGILNQTYTRYKKMIKILVVKLHIEFLNFIVDLNWACVRRTS